LMITSTCFAKASHAPVSSTMSGVG
jgi:hypothetical protein